MNPNMQTFLQAMQGPQASQQTSQPQQSPQAQQQASQGQNGDSIVAHMTPGEIAVPPQLQTPQVLAVLNQAFQQNKVDPQQFTAGSPKASVNPQTGMEQFNFLSAFLPAALGIAGSMVAPELLPAMAPALAGAIGSGAGTAAGGLASGQSPIQAGLSGLGAGAGGYMMGNLGNGLTAMGNTPTGATPIQGPPAPGLSNLWGNLPAGSINPIGMAGSAIGGQIGSSLGAPQKNMGPQLPAGFNTPLTPVSQLPSYQTQLGYNTYKGPLPNFTNFNPATNFPASHNFFPVA